MELHNIISSFNHSCAIQIRFKDIDKQGHVNNAVHLTYFEVARTAYFKNVLRKNNDWIETGIILAATNIVYKAPILLSDELLCYTKITRFGAKSFDVEHLLVIEKEGIFTLVAQGTSTMVCFDYKTNQTILVPSEWIASVKDFEKSESK